MPLTVGSIQMYMGPEETGGPDNLRKAIISFIDGAVRYLDVAIQEIDDMEIARALVRARRRRVVVRIVKEGDYLKAPKMPPDPFIPCGQYEINREIHSLLNRANINVKTDYNTYIFHQKFIVRDRKALLTGSTNFTTTGVTKNLNHVVVIEDDKVARIYWREFQEIMQGRFGRNMNNHGSAPEDVTVEGVPVMVLFAPDHNPEMEIMKQMLKASRRIDFAIFTFSTSSGIDDAMIAQAARGVKVSGILDGKAANQVWAATRPVKNAGAILSKVNKSSTIGKLHHKLMVLDGQVTIVGSFNYTRPATRLNDENIIILGDLEATEPASVEKQKRLAGYALREIERINTIAEPISF